MFTYQITFSYGSVTKTVTITAKDQKEAKEQLNKLYHVEYIISMEEID